MEIIEWWPKLDTDAKAWLIAHNGEPISPEVLSRILATGATVTPSASWVGESGPDGILLSDEAVDWIEATANVESD